MTYLVAIIIFIIGIKIYGSRIDSNNSQVWYVFECIILIFIAGFRAETMGNDAQTYVEEFKQLPTLDELQYYLSIGGRQQPLWYIFNALCKSINSSFLFYQITHAAIVNVTIFWFVKKHFKYKFHFVLLFALLRFWYFEFEIQREILAVCVFLISVSFYLKKNYILYFAGCFISFLFHVSGIITFIFPIIWLLCSKLTNWKYYNLFLIILIGTLFCLPTNIAETLNIIGNYNETIVIQAEHYITKQQNTNALILFILDLIVIFNFYRFRRKNVKEDQFIDINIVTVLLFRILAIKFTGFYRFENYIYIFFIMGLIDTYLKMRKTSLNKVFMYIIFAYIFISRCYDYSIGWGFDKTPLINYYYPYISIFE